jgi:hypothetical protein
VEAGRELENNNENNNDNGNDDENNNNNDDDDDDENNNANPNFPTCNHLNPSNHPLNLPETHPNPFANPSDNEIYF